MLKKIGSNQYLVHHPEGEVLISYETPVAARIGGQYLRTNQFYSVTTSKHINKWLRGLASNVREGLVVAPVNQEYLDNLLKEALGCA